MLINLLRHKGIYRSFSTAPLFTKDIDYYSRMGLKKSASDTEIKKEFYTLAKKYHPDKIENKECKKSEEKFK